MILQPMKTTQKHQPYADGNRLPLAAGLSSFHNAYLADVAAPDSADVEQVLQEVARRKPPQELPYTEIVVLTKGCFSQDTWDAVQRLAQSYCPPGANLNSCSVLLARLAAVHSDESFEGDFFVSRVLAAGPNGYLFQAFHSKVVGNTHRYLEVDCTELLLKAGDVLVFDPTTPHMAAPVMPKEDTVLVLLQLEVRVPDEESLAHLVEHLPPCPVRNNPSRLR